MTSIARDGGLDVVLGAPELDVRAEQRPVRAARPLVRHADAAGIHDPQPVASVRSYCMCVWPQTTTSASTRPKIAASSASGVIRV